MKFNINDSILDSAIWVLLMNLGFTLAKKSSMFFDQEGVILGAVPSATLYMDDEPRFYTDHGRWYVASPNGYHSFGHVRYDMVASNAILLILTARIQYIELEELAIRQVISDFGPHWPEEEIPF